MAEQTFHEAMVDNLRGRPESLEPFLRDSTHVARARVYQNNMLTAAGQVIVDAYPVVATLVGDEFMRALARAYFEVHPPHSPVMTFYGASLPQFLEGFPPAQSLPYLPDVARHDWAFLQALFAADEIPLQPKMMTHLSDDTIAAMAPGLHASVQLLQAPLNAYEIWVANKQVSAVPPSLRKEVTHAMYWRTSSGVQHRTLTPEQFGFLSAIKDGASFSAAIHQHGGTDGFQFFAETLPSGIYSSPGEGPKS